MQRIRQLVSMQADWLRPSADALQQRREIFQRRTFSELKAAEGHIREVKIARIEIPRVYAGPYANDALMLENKVANTWDLTKLLDRAEQALGSHEVTQRRIWLESLSIFDHALALAELEQIDGDRKSSLAMEELIAFLERELITDTKTGNVYTLHDPQNLYRTEGVYIDEDVVRPKGLLLRHDKGKFLRRTIDGTLLYFGHRVKHPYRTWVKVVQQVKEETKDNPCFVRDRRGLRFMVRTIAEAEQLKERMMMLLDAKDLGGNLHGGGKMDESNPHSSTYYRAQKLGFYFVGSYFELIITTFENYYNSKLSHGPENHQLYRLQQLVNIHFPSLFPQEVYSIDWSDQQVQGLLKQCQMIQFGWSTLVPAHT